MSEFKSLYGYELCDALARERLDVIEDELGFGIEYDTREDWGAFLRSIELTEMRKTGIQLTYNTSTGVVTAANVTTGYNVYIFDPEKLPDYALVKVTGNLYLWDGTNYTYFGAGSSTTAGNYGAFDFTTIPSGSYLCYCAKLSNYNQLSGYYITHAIVNPEYVSALNGFDESITDKPIDLPLTVINGKAYLVMDVTNYKYCILRVLGNSIFGGTSYFAKDNENYISSGSTFLTNAFDAVRSGNYLMLNVTGLMTAAPNIRIGIITPRKARLWKSEKRFMNAKHCAHNTDTKRALIMACAICEWVDIDITRTLDGNYVCLHGFEINGKDIGSYSLADLGLTGDQMDRDEALEIMRAYGSYCMHNFRYTDDFNLRLEATEKVYSMCGDAVIYPDFFTTQFLSGLGKYKLEFGGHTSFTEEDIESLGLDKTKIFKWFGSYGSVSADFYGDPDYQSLCTIYNPTQEDKRGRFDYYWWTNAEGCVAALDNMAKRIKIESLDLTDKWDLTAYAEFPYRVLFMQETGDYVLLASKQPIYCDSLTNPYAVTNVDIISNRYQPWYASAAGTTVYSVTNNPSTILAERTAGSNAQTKNGVTYKSWSSGTRWKPVWCNVDLLNIDTDEVVLAATDAPVWGVIN